MEVQKTVDGVVVLKYEDLVAKKDGTKSIEEAFGYRGIGLLIVSGVPEFAKLREALLPLGSQFADLPEEKLNKVVHKESHYSFGWSHGKEILSPGKFDTFKGSYYNNPQYDVPTENKELIKNYPEVCLPNIWPKEDFPELEPAFKNLGRLFVEVGKLIAYQCDQYVKKQQPAFDSKNYLEKVIEESHACKARLLHYFSIDEDKTTRTRESWCGWHNDHGSLTGLTPAMYLVRDKDNPKKFKSIPNPDTDSGLYVRTRDGNEFKVKMPSDCMAFQIGETSQIYSGGVLRATPHAVQAIAYPTSIGVVRDSFAVFMQPNFDKLICVPKGDAKASAVERFREGMNFGDFSKVTLDAYYQGGLPG